LIDPSLQDLFADVGSLVVAKVGPTVTELSGPKEGPLQIVRTSAGWCYDEVIIWDEDDGPWLVASGHLRSSDPPRTDTPELLLSLLTLVRRPIRWDRPDESVYAEGARVWCTEHGLPAVEAVFQNPLFAPGLSLSLFQRETLTLVLLMDVWTALRQEDEAVLARILPELWEAWHFQHEKAVSRHIDYRVRDTGVTDAVPTAQRRALSEMERHYGKKPLARQIIGWVLNERLETLCPQVSWTGQRWQMGLREAPLFDVCYLQLASLLTKPDTEIRAHFKTCKSCEGRFWGHGNARHCSRCDRRTAWSRKDRASRKSQTKKT
jgi:hypothetical protein